MLARNFPAGLRPRLQTSPLAVHSSCYPCHVQLSAWVFHASPGVRDRRVGRCAPSWRVWSCVLTLWELVSSFFWWSFICPLAVLLERGKAVLCTIPPCWDLIIDSVSDKVGRIGTIPWGKSLEIILNFGPHDRVDGWVECAQIFCQR